MIIISARLIRECADLICSPLCVIFNQSLRLGIFPDDWKNARVTPLFKQEEQNDFNNYRPISVISVVAKVFERTAYDQLYTYLVDNDFIYRYQSGFRTNHSLSLLYLRLQTLGHITLTEKKSMQSFSWT